MSTSTSDGTIQWATINNATTTGTAFATFVGSGTATTTYLRISNLGFNIPAGQTITGISFANNRKVAGGKNGNAVDKVVMLVDDTGTIVGNNKASAAIWPITTPATVAYGGDGDTWGVTLTQAQVNSSNFGIVMSAGGAAAGFNRTASTNSWGVSIWYTTSSISTLITVTSTANPSVYGNSVTFTATVTPTSGGPPTGTVTFKDGAATLGTGTLNGATPGVATFATTTLNVAGSPHSITAVYGGDATFTGSTSGALSEAITAKALTVSGITASNKTYDATTAATLVGTPGTLVGVVAGDTVSLAGAAVGTFATSSVGNGITVTVSGQSLTGAQASNYSLTEPTTTANITNPVPTTTSISPTSVTAGGSGFSLQVNGTGFDPLSTVQIGGVNRVTTFASTTQLTAAILTADISSVGTRSITVVNPTPGGGTSNAQTLTVSSAPVAPSIQSFGASPSSVTIGDSQTVTFTWSASGTATVTCVIKDPNNATVASNGVTGTATTTQPQTTSSYKLTCTNTAGSAVATSTVMASSGVTPSSGDSTAPPVNTGGYPPASAYFYGYTYPGADMQVFAKSSVTGPYTSVPFKTVTIADDGSFKISLENFSQANYFFGIQAKDKNGNSTAIISFSQLAVAGVELVVRDILIPPTLALDSASVAIKNPVMLSGYAIPGATLNFLIDGKTADTGRPDASGFYSFAATTTGLSLGSHSVQVKEVFAGKTSDSSLQKTFMLATQANSIVDLNGDQSATISDWSILLSRWRSTDKAVQQTIDFNRDGKVDIRDFSIFLTAFQQARNAQ